MRVTMLKHSSRLIADYLQRFRHGKVQTHYEYANKIQREDGWMEVVGIDYIPCPTSIRNVLVGQPTNSPKKRKARPR